MTARSAAASETVVTDAPRLDPTAIGPAPGGGFFGHASDLWAALPGPEEAMGGALAAVRTVASTAAHALPPALTGGGSDAGSAEVPPLLAVSVVALGACLVRALTEGGAHGSYPALSPRSSIRGLGAFRPTAPNDHPTEGGTRASSASPGVPRARPD